MRSFHVPAATGTSLALGATVFLLLSGNVSAADPQNSTNIPAMQVYHECTEPVYCKNFALTGKSTGWELVPASTVKSYNYPTEQYNATVWCGKAPNEDAYSWMELSLDGGVAAASPGVQEVSYTAGNYGVNGDKTQPPFSQGGTTTIGPVNGALSEQTRCGIISCESGDTSCVSGQSDQGSHSCSPDKDIRWSFCMGSQQQSNSTVSAGVRLRAARAATFVA